jgi:archaeal type IV pilus assembly protein PilA
MNTYIRKIKKNSKALSPVVASIILIAVTVAVSVVVAAWMGGMTIGLMGTAEQGTITNLDLTAANTVIATVQNTGSAPIVLSAGYVNGVVAISNPGYGSATATIAKGQSMSFSLTTAAPGLALTSGDQVTVKFTTAKGNNIVLSQYKP